MNATPNKSFSDETRQFLGLNQTSPAAVSAQNRTDTPLSLAAEVIHHAQVTNQAEKACIAQLVGKSQRMFAYIPQAFAQKRIRLNAYNALYKSSGSDFDDEERGEGTPAEAFEGLRDKSEKAIKSVPLTRFFRLGGLTEFFPGPADLLEKHARLSRIRDVFQKTLDVKNAEQAEFQKLAKGLRARIFPPKVEGIQQTQDIVSALDAELKRLGERKANSQIDKKRESVEGAIQQLKSLVMKRDPKFLTEIDQAIIDNASGNSEGLRAIFERMRGDRTLSASEKAVLEDLARTLGQGNFLRAKGFLSGALKGAKIAAGVGVVAGVSAATMGVGGALLSWWGASALMGAGGAFGAYQNQKTIDGRNIGANELHDIYQTINRDRHQVFHPQNIPTDEVGQKALYEKYFSEVTKMGVGGRMILARVPGQNESNKYLISGFGSKGEVFLVNEYDPARKVVIDSSQHPPKYIIKNGKKTITEPITIQTRYQQEGVKTDPFIPAMVCVAPSRKGQINTKIK